MSELVLRTQVLKKWKFSKCKENYGKIPFEYRPLNKGLSPIIAAMLAREAKSFKKLVKTTSHTSNLRSIVRNYST